MMRSNGIPNQTPRILVVDDQPLISELFCSVLEEEGWKVDIASTADEAAALCAANAYDFITLDCILPDTNGHRLHKRLIETCKTRAAEHGVAPRLPRVLFITGDPRDWMPNDLVQRKNVVGVLHKPVELHDLIRMVGDQLAANT